MRKRLSVCTSLFTVFILGSILSCSQRDEMTAILEMVREGETLGEKHDVGGLIRLTTEDFVAMPGNLDRRETRKILWLAFRHYGGFKVLYPLPTVEVKPGHHAASVGFPFLILRKEASFPRLKKLYEDPRRWIEEVGEHADLYRLKLELVESDGRWLAKQAHLERFTGVSFED